MRTHRVQGCEGSGKGRVQGKTRLRRIKEGERDEGKIRLREIKEGERLVTDLILLNPGVYTNWVTNRVVDEWNVLDRNIADANMIDKH